MDIFLETQKAYRSLFEINGNTDGDKLADELEQALKKELPKFGVSAKFSSNMHPTITIYITYGKDKSEYTNGIWQNDRLAHVSTISGFDREGNINSDKLQAKALKSIIITDDAPDGLAFGSIKSGWRNFKADPKKIVSKYVDYAKKIKKITADNMDKFKPGMQKFLKDKIK